MQVEKNKKNKKDKLIEGLILCGISAVLILILFGAFGKSGQVVADFFKGVFGYAIFGVAFAMLAMGIACLAGFNFSIEKNTLLGGILMFVAFILIFQVVTGKQYLTSYGGYLKGCYDGANTAGGALFGLIAFPLAKINYVFAIVVFSLLLVGAVVLAFFVKINKQTNWRWHNPKNKSASRDGATLGNMGAEGVDVKSDLNVVKLDGSTPKDKLGHSRFNRGHDELKSIDELDKIKQINEFNQEDVVNIPVNKINVPPKTSQKTEIKPEIDEAMAVLYEDKSQKKVDKENLTKESAASILYGQEELKSTKPKKHEFTKEEYENYTSNARMRTIIENMRMRGELPSENISIEEQVEAALDDPRYSDTLVNDKFEEREFQDNLDSNMGISDAIRRNSNIDNTQAEGLNKTYADFNNSKPIDLSATNPEPTQSFEDMLAEKARIKREQEEQERMRAHTFRDALTAKKEESKANNAPTIHDQEQTKRDELQARKEELLRRRAERSDKGGSHVSPPTNGSTKDGEILGRGINFGLPTKSPSKPQAVTLEDGGDKGKMPKPKPRAYKAPHIALLNEYISTPPENEDFSEKIKVLEDLLISFGISAKVVNVVTGPTFTRLELQMPVGISVNRVNALVNDIAMCLEATSIRLQTPIPGKNLFGVELPNKSRGTVGLKALFNSPDYNNNKHALSFALGQDCDGHQYVIDLAKAPHMLIAGATGAGKSVCINTLVCSILYKYSPADVKIALVDPKQVELSMYNGLPHMLIEESIYDKEKVLNLLDWAIDEMEARYGLLKSRRVNSINDFNDTALRNGEEKLPYIVIIIDEVADIVNSMKKEFEERIVRIAQKARAAGIILVLATQRPSVDIITGTIKANLPSRIAFAVASQVDSKTIMDTAGAEKLLRNGDMLYMAGTNPVPVRVQGAFINGKEVDAICEYIKQNNDSYFDPDIAAVINKSNKPEPSAKNAEITGGDSDIDGEFVKVLKYIVEIGECSVSKLQRRFGYGFPRAAKFVDKMEELGYVGKSIDNKKREVFLDLETFMSVYGDFELE